MSFFDRSVPLKYTLLTALAFAAFAAITAAGFYNREAVMRSWSPVPAKIDWAGKPKTVNCILGLGCNTYTKARVKVTPAHGEPWYYDGQLMNGRAVVGQKVQVWLHKGNPNDAYIGNEYNPSGETYSSPWLTWEYVIAKAGYITFFGAAGTLIFMSLLVWLLKRRKKAHARRVETRKQEEAREVARETRKKNARVLFDIASEQAPSDEGGSLWAATK